MEITIGNRKVGPSHPPFILAEMSGNHNQSLDRALEIVEAAAKSGAHAVKLQTYTAETMTLDIHDREFMIDDPKSLWKGMSLYNLYEKAHTPWEWHEPIFKKCEELGILCFSTPFDATAVDFLEELNVPAYKIASFENTDHELIKKVASTGKPIIISTGMASLAELAETVDVAKSNGANDLILLKCTTSYPATPDKSHIRTIPHMRDLFNVQVGLSDHTLGVGVAVASVALGATFIEKHFTLSRADGGVDADFSIEPHELKMLVEESERAWQGLGHIQYGSSGDRETKFKEHRRSLYISEDVVEGEELSLKNIKAIRPGLGLPVKYLEKFIGKKVNKNVPKGTPLSFELIG
jgi:pseudaminic acid synthase